MADISMSEAAELRKEWAAKGDPPCEHPHVVKERHDLGASTGDYVCDTCGELWWHADPDRPRR